MGHTKASQLCTQFCAKMTSCVVSIIRYLHICFEVGQIRILQLREQSKQRLGDKFDIRRFHDVVLECAGPLDILEKRVNEYINNTATA